MNTVTVKIHIEQPLGPGETSIRTTEHSFEATAEDERTVQEMIDALMADPAEFKRRCALSA